MRMNKMRRLFYVLIAFAMMATLVPSTEVSANSATPNGDYTVGVSLYKNDTELSMANSTVNPLAVLKVNDGVYTIELDFTTMTMSGVEGYLSGVEYYTDGSTKTTTAAVNVLEQGTATSGASYVKKISFNIPDTSTTDTYLKVGIVVEGMMTMDQDVILRVDYSSLPEEVVSKDDLTTKVTEAEAITGGSYTAASFAALQTAINEAKTVLNDTTATQTQVNDKLAALQAAINGLIDNTSTEGATLVKRQEVDVVQLASTGAASTEEDAWVEYTGVVETYSNGVTLMTLQTKTAGKSGLTAYLKSFKIMNADGVYLEALYGDLDEEGFPTSVTFPIEIKEGTVVEELLMAYMPVPTPSYFLTMFPDGHEVGQKLQIEWDNAVTVLDFTELNALIDSAKAYDSSEYTEESFAALTAAITAAETVSANASSTQAEIDAQVAALQAAIDGLVVVEADVLEDGVYEVPVALWHATEDQASMANSALLPTSRIVVSDGEATMYIYTQEMQFGTITASLQELKIVSLARSYTNAVVETKDADGNPTSFSFILPHMNEYLDVLVNPQVALMGNQDIAARLKIDYTAMEKVSDDTDLSVAPGATDDSGNTGNTGNTSNPTTPAATNQSASVAAGDTTNSALLLAMLVMAGMAGMYVTARAKKQ